MKVNFRFDYVQMFYEMVLDEWFSENVTSK